MEKIRIGDKHPGSVLIPVRYGTVLERTKLNVTRPIFSISRVGSGTRFVSM
jgi:hypothetical protein